MTRSVRRLFRTSLLATLAAGLAVLLPPADAQQPKANGKVPVKPVNQPPASLKKRVILEGVNEAAAWAVRVNVDRDDHTYQAGDQVIAEVVSEQSGHLYLFNIDAKGEIDLIYPNGGEQDNRITANEKVTVPGPNAGFRFTVSSVNAGTEYLKAVVSKNPLSELAGEIKKSRGMKTPITIKSELFHRAMREAALGANRHTVADTGSVTRDLDTLRRSAPKAGKIVAEQVDKQAGSWAEHQVEIYTGPKGNGKQSAGGERRAALLVGISKFASPSIRALGCAHKDALDLGSALRSRFDDVTVLTDSQATLSAVRAAFTRLVEGTKAGDTVLVYWAGHGGRCANTDNTEPDGFDEYLVPHDGSLAGDDEIRATMLTSKAFGRWIQELNGRKVVVILDTCHSGGQVAGMKMPTNAPRGVKGPPRGARGVDAPNIRRDKEPTAAHMLSGELVRAGKLRTRNIGRSDAAVLCSAGPKEFAFEMQTGANGVMTHYVLEYLRSNPSNVTLKAVADYVTPKVQGYVAQNYPGSPQTPVFSDETVWTPILLTP